MSTGRRDLSLGRLALYSLGAAAGVLVFATVVVAVFRPPPVVGLIVVLVGVAGAIAAMGTVSTRMTRRAFDDTVSDSDPDAGAEL